MSPKTESPPGGNASVFSKEYLLKVIGIVAAVLLVVVGVVYGSGDADPSRGVFQVVFAFPWVIAGGITISNGLQRFSGTPLADLSQASLWHGLTPLLVLGVIGATACLLLMSSKEHRSEVSPAREAFYLFGLILSSVYLLVLIPMAAMHATTWSTMQDVQAVQRNKDHIIGGIAGIAWRVREYAILPTTVGGGSGDIASFRLESAVDSGEDARYAVRWEEGSAVITARSIPYEGSTVQVHIDRTGKITEWKYTGRFQ